MSFEQVNPKLTLEQQFQRRDVIELPGRDIEVVDIDPEDKKTEVLVVLGVGWGGEPNAYKNNLLYLASKGRRTIALDAVHGIETENQDDIENIFPDAEMRKVAALLEVLTNKNISKVDAVAYSEGGIYITLAAILYPEKFRNLVLVNPGGLVGKDNEFRLTAGFLKDLVKHFIDVVNNKEFLKRFAIFYGGMVRSAAIDLPKAIREISAISEAQIQDFLKDLKSQGMGISIIHGVDDNAFPMDKMQQVVKPDQVDGFYSVKGAHGDFVIQAEKYTEVVDQALDALEKKKNKL